MGWKGKADQAQASMIRGVKKSPCGLSAVMGLTLKERVTIYVGLEANQPKRWANDGRGPTAEMEEARSSQSMAQNKGKRSLEKGSLLDCKITSNGSSLEGEHLIIWEIEEIRKKREKVILLATDKALVEEAMRYDFGLRIERERSYEFSHLILYSFDRTLEGESFDHSGVLGERNEVGPGMDGNGCWDLVEFNKDRNLARGVEWNSERTDLQEVRNKKDDGWEESSLAKFSNFLGLSTKGLEKEILNFLIKIRNRRERIHSKELEKSKFERELKKLECSVNYEKGYKQKDPSQGKGDQLAID